MKITSGLLSFDYAAGALRKITLGETEVIRGIAYLVRDRDWGTLVPQITDERMDPTRISYRARFESGAAALVVSVVIDFAEGLHFTASAQAEGEFETNRAGFTVLHPIAGVAGAPVLVEHCDGTIRSGHFPELIEPWQPFQDLRALTHHAGGWRISCRMEGDAFEMEDQRQWGDASYKTYVRPLARPWPYTIADGVGFDQAVRLNWQAEKAANIPLPGHSGRGIFPQTALVITPAEAQQAALRPADLALIKPQRLLCHFDATVHGLAELRSFAALQAVYDAQYDLELIARANGDLAEEFAQHARDVAASGLNLASVMICPSVDRQSTPPGSEWPPCPPLPDIYQAARAAFPGVEMGGGMVSFFPELNRKRPAVEMLDFVSHGLCPIVHDASDAGVMQTLESVPHITASARAIIAGKPYRLGPSTIAMRQNPYGSRTIPNPDGARICMTDDDPRHRTVFGAAYMMGLAAALIGSGITVWTPAGLYGPRGVMDWGGRPYALARVLAELSARAGQAVEAEMLTNISACLRFDGAEMTTNLASYVRTELA